MAHRDEEEGSAENTDPSDVECDETTPDSGASEEKADTGSTRAKHSGILKAVMKDTYQASASQASRGWKRVCALKTSTKMFLAVFLLVIITLIILIPTVFLNHDVWTHTAFSLHSGYHGRVNQYDEEFAYFGSKVALSSDGSRMAFMGRHAAEIWDLSKNGEWEFKFRFEGEGISYENMEMSMNGSRLALAKRGQKACNVVVVFEAAHIDGREWTQIGEALDCYTYLAFTYPDKNVREFDENDSDSFLYFNNRASEFGDALSLSDDGSILAVGAYSTSKYKHLGGSFTSFDQDVGTVQIFKQFNSSWLPVNEFKGVRDGDRIGSSVKLTSDGSKVIFSGTGVKVHVAGILSDTTYLDFPDIYFSQQSNLDGGRIATSQKENAQLVAVSARTFHTYTGIVRIYNLIDGRYKLEDEFRGSAEYENFGKSLSLSASGDILVVGSDLGITSYRRSNDGKWAQYGEVFGTSIKQRDCCTDMNSFGDSVAISGAGDRVIGGARNRKNEHEGILSTGDIGIFELRG